MNLAKQSVMERVGTSVCPICAKELGLDIKKIMDTVFGRVTIHAWHIVQVNSEERIK